MGIKGFSDSGSGIEFRPANGHVCLEFKRKNSPFPDKNKWSFGENISALAAVKSTLFCASDETVSVERLVLSDDGTTFNRHKSFSMREFFILADDSSEIDVEGLVIADHYLWLVGSHSLKRAEPEAGGDVPSLASMVSWDSKRAFLARIPIVEKQNGIFSLEKIAGSRTAAMVAPGSGRDEGLRGLLSQEGLLHPFMNIPSKENGFDIEGIAVAGERVFLGLRGPVIASFALIVELRLEEENGVLVPRRIGERRYRLHAVNLGGLGVRDLTVDGNRLLVLSGTSQKAESIQRVFAVDFNALSNLGGVLHKKDVKLLLTLPVSGWGDHAEGMTLLPGRPKRLLIAYDSPSENRHNRADDRLIVDIFNLGDDGKVVRVPKK